MTLPSASNFDFKAKPTVVDDRRMRCPVCREVGRIKSLTYQAVPGKIYRHMDGSRASCIPSIGRR